MKLSSDMQAVLFAQSKKHQEQLDEVSRLEIHNLEKEVDLVKKEAPRRVPIQSQPPNGQPRGHEAP